MKNKIIFLGFCVIFSQFITAAELDILPSEENLAAARTLITKAQIALAAAQEKQVPGDTGAGESVMLLANAATNNAPDMLTSLPLLGINHQDLSIFALKDPNHGVIQWFKNLSTGQNPLFDRGVFDIARITRGISKADNLATGLNINPLQFATQTYNLVRRIFELNPKDSNAKDIVFQYFNKLDEQDAQCCAGFVGRTFHAFTTAYIYLVDRLEKQLQSFPVAAHADEDEEFSGINQGDALLAAQMQLVEMLAAKIQRLTNEFDKSRAAIVDDWEKTSPIILIHSGTDTISPLYLSLEGKYGADGRTANRLYKEAKVIKEAERIATEQKKQAALAAAKEEQDAKVAKIKKALEEAEARIYGSVSKAELANAIFFRECMEEVMQTHRRVDVLLALDLVAQKKPSLQTCVDLLKRAHLIRQEPNAPKKDIFASTTEVDKWTKDSNAYVLIRLQEGM